MTKSTEQPQEKIDFSAIDHLYESITGRKPVHHVRHKSVTTDKELIKMYRLDGDDADALADARLLHRLRSFSGYEAIGDIGDLTALQTGISTAYGRALQSDNRSLIACAEQAVEFHGRLKTFLLRMLTR